MLSKRGNRPLPRKRSQLDVDSEESHEGAYNVSNVTSECDKGVVDIEDTSFGNN